MVLINMYCAYYRAAARSMVKDERGATLVEYALLTVLIAVVCVAAISMVGTATSASLSRSGSSIQ